MGTAVYLQHLGFSALATTSAGFAFSRALPDQPAAISRAAMLSHIREIAQVTSLPVNADFQNAYADEPEDVAESVKLCVATGVSGLSVEDSTGNKATPLYESSVAVERVKAARHAIDETGVPVILTARCEALLISDAQPLKTAIERLVAYSEAGADCLFAPGVRDPNDIKQIVKAVAPKPVNVLVFTPDPNLSVARLADLGVRRISVGAALARVAWAAFIKAARTIATTGSFEGFADAASSGDLNGIFRARL